MATNLTLVACLLKRMLTYVCLNVIKCQITLLTRLVRVPMQISQNRRIPSVSENDTEWRHHEMMPNNLQLQCMPGATSTRWNFRLTAVHIDSHVWNNRKSNSMQCTRIPEILLIFCHTRELYFICNGKPVNLLSLKVENKPYVLIFLLEDVL